MRDLSRAIEQIGVIPKDLYFNLPQGEAVVMVQVFGIKYGDEVKSQDYTEA